MLHVLIIGMMVETPIFRESFAFTSFQIQSRMGYFDSLSACNFFTRLNVGYISIDEASKVAILFLVVCERNQLRPKKFVSFHWYLRLLGRNDDLRRSFNQKKCTFGSNRTRFNSISDNDEFVCLVHIDTPCLSKGGTFLSEDVVRKTPSTILAK